MFKGILEPEALKYKPDFVLISAGFDAHYDDPLSGISLSEKGFETMTVILKGIANECCNGRLISVLEGGYDLSALPKCVNVHLLTLMD